jgi:hypothetical protein
MLVFLTERLRPTEKTAIKRVERSREQGTVRSRTEKKQIALLSGIALAVGGRDARGLGRIHRSGLLLPFGLFYFVFLFFSFLFL